MPDIATTRHRRYVSHVDDDFFEALQSGDFLAVKQVIARASEVGVPLRVLLLEVMAPALVTLGDLSESEEIDIGRVDLASAVVRDLISWVQGDVLPTSRTGGTAVAVSAAGERHDLRRRMLVSLLEEQGWSAIFLGADTPVESAITMVNKSFADSVVVSIGSPDGVAYVSDLVDHVASLHRKVTIVVGGRGATAAASELAALNVAVVDDAVQAVDHLTELATSLRSA